MVVLVVHQLSAVHPQPWCVCSPGSQQRYPQDGESARGPAYPWLLASAVTTPPANRGPVGRGSRLVSGTRGCREIAPGSVGVSPPVTASANPPCAEPSAAVFCVLSQ